MRNGQRIQKMPAANERFGATAAVTPQTILWEIERYYPAATVVEAATSQSRWDVIGKRRERRPRGQPRKESIT